MKSIVFRYGIYASLIIVVLGTAGILIGKNLDYSTQEIIGYLTILVAMIFVFLGIRHYRNHVNGGSLTFGQGLKTGLLIVLIPAVAFGLFNILYTEVINPTWKDDYYSAYIENLKKTTPAGKIDAAIKKAEQQKEMFANPVFEFILMAGTVFIIGFMVTIISALSLRRNKSIA